MRKIIAAVMFAAIFSLAGCCTACKQRYKNARPLENTVWHLVKMGGEQVDVPADVFNLTLSEGNLSGVAACNRFAAQYTLGEKFSIRVTPVVSTRMACHENEALESRFLEVVGGASHYDIDYDMLMIIKDGAVKAVLKAQN